MTARMRLARRAESAPSSDGEVPHLEAVAAEAGRREGERLRLRAVEIGGSAACSAGDSAVGATNSAGKRPPSSR